MSDEIQTLSYERALAEVDELIAKLEKGDVDLDEAIACYERGSRLAQHCATLLDRTEQKVTQLVVGAGGRLTEKPLAASPSPPEESIAPARARAVGPEPGAAGPPGDVGRAVTEPRQRGPADDGAQRPLFVDPGRTPGIAPRQRPPAIDPDDIPF